MLPFVWRLQGDETDQAKLIKKLEENHWQESSIKEFPCDEDSGPNSDLSPEQCYKTVQYFTESARQSAFGWDKDYIRCFSFDRSAVHEKALYYNASKTFVCTRGE